jgi:hypothetical protein
MDKSLHDRIARVAYDLYEKKGRRNGGQEEDWIEAERIVRAQLAKEAAPKKAQKAASEAGKAPGKIAPRQPAPKKAAKPAGKPSATRRKTPPQATI